jgi:hypothetical protein
MAPGVLHAQFDFHVDGRDVEVHSFAQQGFVYSSANNFLTMDTSSGSFGMTDFGANISTKITDKFRVGAQIFDYNLGALGNWKPQLDWAFGDYKFNSYFGVRAGKVKTPIGLFNDVQDVDVLFPWALLPESVYPPDLRAFHLAHVGFVAYGGFGLPAKAGSVSWQGYAGLRTLDQDGGIVLAYEQSGTILGHTSGPTIGADIRWNTPVTGLFLGASYAKTELNSPAAVTDDVPGAVKDKYDTQDFYADFEKGRLKLDVEATIEPSWLRFGNEAFVYNPSRIWYVMGAWHFTRKFTGGSYYSRDFSFDGDRDRSNPANYSKELALTGRYDFSHHIYVKLEGHYIDGTGDGFYTGDNPRGLDRVSKILIAKIGYAF